MVNNFNLIDFPFPLFIPLPNLIIQVTSGVTFTYISVYSGFSIRQIKFCYFIILWRRWYFVDYSSIKLGVILREAKHSQTG